MDDTQDRFLRWPSLWVLGACFFFVFMHSFNGGDLLLVLMLLSPLPYLSAFGAFWLACTALVLLWGALRHRHWRRGLSAAVLPVSLMLACLNPKDAMTLAERVGDRVRLQFLKPGYFEKINSSNSERDQRLAVFLWGGFAGLGERAMVYDESDEILLEESQRSDAWKKRAEKTDLACKFMALPMEGHFYKVYLDC